MRVALEIAAFFAAASMGNEFNLTVVPGCVKICMQPMSGLIISSIATRSFALLTPVPTIIRRLIAHSRQ